MKKSTKTVLFLTSVCTIFLPIMLILGYIKQPPLWAMTVLVSFIGNRLGYPVLILTMKVLLGKTRLFLI